MNTSKLFDGLILVTLLILAPVVSYLYKLPLLGSIVLFYGLPALWLSFRIPGCAKRAAIFSIIGTVLFFVLDYVAVTDGAWWVSTIFKFRLLGILPIEDSIWFFAGSYLVVMFYERFDDKWPHRIKKTKIKYLPIIVGLITLAFIGSLLFYPKLLAIPYAYFWIGLIFSLVGTFIIMLRYPRLRRKLWRTNLYLFALQLPFEIIALKIGQWSFPGHNFIAWINIAGVRFPLEELIVYISMTGVALLVYYEFYDDDCK